MVVAIVYLVMQGKVKILKSYYEKLGSELDMKSFDDSWKDKVSKSVKVFETMSVCISNHDDCNSIAS